MRILFTGGSSGGHIFPIISVIKELKKIHSQTTQPLGPGSETDLGMFFVGANSPFRKLLQKEGVEIKVILMGKARRYFSWRNIVDLFKVPIGFLQSLWLVYKIMPDVIFSKGGYDSVPVVFAGWFYRIPILIHESDVVPGLANRLSSKLSKRVAISFVSTENYFPPQKTVLIGNPVRLTLVQSCLSGSEADKKNAKDILKVTGEKPIIFVFGGSQGAQKINEIILGVLPRLLETYEIIHQCGDGNEQEIKKKLGENSFNGYYLFSFLDERQLSSAYLLSDLVIARAGAGSIFEIAACGKPSILIPLPGAAAEHQKENAFAYAKAGATSVIEQINLTPNLFLNEVDKILSDENVLLQMTKNAKNFSQLEASYKIARELINLGQ